MRRKRAPKRPLLADPKYGSELLSKFINHVMVDGKYSLAQRIVYQALKHATSLLTESQVDEKLLEFKKNRLLYDVSQVGDHQKTNDNNQSGQGQVSETPFVDKILPNEKPLLILEYVLDVIRPKVEVKARRVGGATYQIPIEVDLKRGFSLAMRWLLSASRSRSEKSIILRIATEVVDAFYERGISVKKRDDTHRMAKANQPFAHYKW